jgi:hypothetical protein
MLDSVIHPSQSIFLRTAEVLPVPIFIGMNRLARPELVEGFGGVLKFIFFFVIS